MSAYDYDLFVIGAGSGGVRGARMAAATGARVGIAEGRRVGGTCVLRGCVPKKLLVYAAHFAHDFADAAAYGWRLRPPTHEWAQLIQAKNTETDRLNGIYIRLLQNAGVTIHDGYAKFIDAHTLDVGGSRITAERILIASGGHPVIPAIPGAEHAITSDEALDLLSRPERIVIVGAGYIAVEFAGIFAGLGSDVKLLVRSKLLRGFDADVVRELGQALERAGIEMVVGAEPAAIAQGTNGYTVTMQTGETIETDLVMFAAGRDPNIKGMGLEEIGVDLKGGKAIKVDAFSKTSVDNIYAVGDVTDRMALTPVAIHEAMCFVDTVYKGKPRKPNYQFVPTAVFSDPPIGTVGLTEEDAIAKYGEVDVYTARFRPMKHTLTGRDHVTFMKLIVDPDSDQVLGCHMIGEDAAEIAQGLGIAMKAGATKADFDATIGIHPTAAEEFVTMREKRAPPQAAAAE
jgi:glutathione reductase (NADPH)